jgi:hypothetical protein
VSAAEPDSTLNQNRVSPRAYDGSALGRVAAAHDRAQTVFGQVMGLVALTAECAAHGAYVGRDLTSGTGIAFFLGALEEGLPR